MKFLCLTSFLLFTSVNSIAWDGYEEGRPYVNIYINPSEKIKVGNTVSFIEKEIGNTYSQKKY